MTISSLTQDLSVFTRQPISACIICFNEEDNIRRCLESLKWVKDSGGEIIVVDSFSTDRTLEICRQYTDKIFQNKWPGFVNQSNYALKLASNEWVLSLDADEILSDQARFEIIQEWKNSGYQKYDGYYFKRHTFYLGKWINHGGWYPDYKLRLFRRSKGKWGGSEPHSHVVINERALLKSFKGELSHHTYKNISDQIRTIDKYSTVAAEQLAQRGKFSIFKLLLHPPFRFFKEYIFKLGFLDGLPGLIIIVSTMYYVFIKYAKLWELTMPTKGKENGPS